MNTKIVPSFLLALSLVAISACGGGANPEEEQQPISTNQPPTISGNMPVSIVAGQSYDSTPTASDPENDTLTFSISNKPTWAEFNSATGNLSGTPSSQDVGIDNDIVIGVSDSVNSVSLSAFDISVQQIPQDNRAPTIADQNLSTSVNTQLVITLGPLQDEDGDTLTYIVTNTSNTTAGESPNQIIFSSQDEGSDSFTASVSDGVNQSVDASITVVVSSSIGSNFITGRGLISPTLGNTAPSKGETRIDPVTGTKITRLTDSSELPGTSMALIVYSRYTPENSDGTYFLAFGSNSASSWVIERTTGNIIAELRSNSTSQIGENHEVRWDTTGLHPNRVYFRDGMKFFMIDDVTDQDNTRSVIKDFSSLIPGASKLYNDVEGDSSNDNDHWAWMASHYNGTTYVVDAFVHYQISTDTVDIMTTSDMVGTDLDHYVGGSTFPRPNMVEISPLGTGVILHYGRAWGTPSYGSRSSDIGTWFDGAHLWPLDFNVSNKTPVKISISETHSGWSFDNDGNEYFVSQNNRTDRLDAIKLDGANAGYDNRIEVASHSDFGWSNGFHYGKMPESKKDWIFINTYTASNNSEWGANQLIMMQMKSESNNPIIWRIGSNYNSFDGDYRDEAPAAINLLGNRIYVSIDWGGMLANNEVFVFELPDNWQDNF